MKPHVRPDAGVTGGAGTLSPTEAVPSASPGQPPQGWPDDDSRRRFDEAMAQPREKSGRSRASADEEVAAADPAREGAAGWSGVVSAPSALPLPAPVPAASARETLAPAASPAPPQGATLQAGRDLPPQAKSVASEPPGAGDAPRRSRSNNTAADAPKKAQKTKQDDAPTAADALQLLAAQWNAAIPAPRTPALDSPPNAEDTEVAARGLAGPARTAALPTAGHTAWRHAVEPSQAIKGSSILPERAEPALFATGPGAPGLHEPMGAGAAPHAFVLQGEPAARADAAHRVHAPDLPAPAPIRRGLPVQAPQASTPGAADKLLQAQDDPATIPKRNAQPLKPAADAAVVAASALDSHPDTPSPSTNAGAPLAASTETNSKETPAAARADARSTEDFAPPHDPTRAGRVRQDNSAHASYKVGMDKPERSNARDEPPLLETSADDPVTPDAPTSQQLAAPATDLYSVPLAAPQPLAGQVSVAPPAETPGATLARELADTVTSLLVGWKPGDEIARMPLRHDLLPATVLTVQQQQAGAQLVVTFECAALASRQLLERAAPQFARSLAAGEKRRVVLRVQDTSGGVPLEIVAEAGEVTG